MHLIYANRYNPGDIIKSAVYSGWVHHKRYQPKEHAFAYRIFLLWLDLDQLDQLDQFSPWLSISKKTIMRFRRSDYLYRNNTLGSACVWNKVDELGADIAQSQRGKVFFLGQPRCLGVYFSPLNVYYCFNRDQQLVCLLAEVSNTPWNQRHHYLIDASQAQPVPKNFHVSPFMDMDMHYRWRFNLPDQQLRLHIESHSQSKIFDASLNLHRRELSKPELIGQLRAMPAMTIKTIATIYWQALRLWLKRVPFVSYQQPRNK